MGNKNVWIDKAWSDLTDKIDYTIRYIGVGTPNLTEEATKKVADLWMKSTTSDFIARWDFRAPEDMEDKVTSVKMKMKVLCMGKQKQ